MLFYLNKKKFIIIYSLNLGQETGFHIDITGKIQTDVSKPYILKYKNS